MKILTRCDVGTFIDNSGVVNWEWGGNASLKGFENWIFLNCDNINTDDYANELAAYLVSVGENPSNYFDGQWS